MSTGNTIADSAIIILSGIIFYILSILSVIAVLYSYLKQWDATAQTLRTIEDTLVNPIAIIIIRVINYGKYLAIPTIVAGLFWYTMYAKVKIPT